MPNALWTATLTCRRCWTYRSAKPVPWLPNLVYVGSGHEVVTVIVAGKVRVRDSEVLTADEDAVRVEVQMQAEALAQRLAAGPVYEGMALLEAMKVGPL